MDRPRVLTAANSSLRVILNRRGTRIVTGIVPLKDEREPAALLPVLDGMPFVLNLGALRQKTLPALLTTALENSTPGLCGHPGTKTVLTLSDAFGRLICALAHGFGAFLGQLTLTGRGD